MKKVINGLSVNEFGNPKNQPVIFVHGFPLDHKMWEFQIEEFEKDYYCIAYDVRGLGESPADCGQFTLEMFVDDLFSIIDELKLNKPFLCGLSMGGYISLRALERDQSKFKGVILCDTRPDADSDEAKLRRTKKIKQINVEGPETFIHEFVTSLFADETIEDDPELYNSVLNRSKQFSKVGVKGALLAILSRTDTTKFLPSIKIPALVLGGSFDNLTPPPVMRAMADKIKNSEYAVIPKAGHMAPLENSECVNDLIRNFMQKNKG